MHFVTAKGILSSQNGMNLYRGCSHGCIYCDSRSRCYHMEHAFEDIEVKENLAASMDALREGRLVCSATLVIISTASEIFLTDSSVASTVFATD